MAWSYRKGFHGTHTSPAIRVLFVVVIRDPLCPPSPHDTTGSTYMRSFVTAAITFGVIVSCAWGQDAKNTNPYKAPPLLERPSNDPSADERRIDEKHPKALQDRASDSATPNPYLAPPLLKKAAAEP